jgi:hypothetical protein
MRIRHPRPAKPARTPRFPLLFRTEPVGTQVAKGAVTRWIVQLALRRPYTFVVLAMLIVLMGVVEILRTPTDIYPEIDIPVVAAVWSYSGLPPSEMEGRITTQFERATTTTVSGLEHIESQTLAGVSVTKIFRSTTAARSTWWMASTAATKSW